VQAYWADEAGTATATKPKFRRIELKLKKLLAFYYATDEEIQDASVLASLAQAAFAEEMAFKVDDALIRGTGAGNPLGILNSGSLVSVAKETGQAAGTIVYENIIKMEARMPARSQLRASYFINVNCMPQIMLMTLPGGTASTPVYLPPNGAAGAPYGTLMGKPIIKIEQCSSVGTQGDVILADWSQYRLATKGGLQQAQSIHVQFLTGEQVFRFAYRVDGQPARAKPLTPYKGSETQGPFVVLDTRA
jgi:HK97 family phage major capsid protein